MATSLQEAAICCFLSWKTHEQWSKLHCSWVSFNEQWSMLHCPWMFMLYCSWVFSMDSGACSTVPVGLVQFNAKNTLNRVRSNKIKKIFFIFNCVLFEKIVLNIIQ
jgi:hypothetical protein